MLKIRLKREGKNKKPVYKIVLSENLKKRNAKYFLIIGFYNPIKKCCQLNKFLLTKYLNYGACPTNTVRHIIQKYIKSM
jgi:small subunit ribosomal protein S16